MKSSKFVDDFPTVVPILPLRDMVVFPNVMIPLFLKGSRVVKLAESVVDGDNLVGLFYQKARNRLNAPGDEISMVGTLAADTPGGSTGEWRRQGHRGRHLPRTTCEADPI